jgi:hypothetical protein
MAMVGKRFLPSIVAIVVSCCASKLGAEDVTHLRQVAYPDMVAFDVLTGKKDVILLKASEAKFSTIIWDGTIIVNAGKHQSVYGMRSIHEDSDGYRFYDGKQYELGNGSFDKRFFVLSGSEWFLRGYYSQSETRYFRFFSDAAVERLRNAVPNEKYGLDNPYYGFVDDGIESISAWSELSETLKGRIVRYRAENMKRPIIVGIQETVGVELNQIAPPWVEGVDGPGIGGTIDIEFSRAAKELIILNGYVDLIRRDLYRKNNRLKTIRIESESPAFSMSATLEDVVRFHEVALPAATSKVRLTILSVYKGTKYDDTCISKIFIPQEELRPRAAYEAEVEKALREAGYLK